MIDDSLNKDNNNRLVNVENCSTADDTMIEDSLNKDNIIVEKSLILKNNNMDDAENNMDTMIDDSLNDDNNVDVETFIDTTKAMTEASAAAADVATTTAAA